MRLLSLVFALSGATGVLMGTLSDTAKPKPQTKTKPSVDYARHIAPILNKRCVECHRPDDVAPFSLMGYDNARRWAPMMAAVTKSKRMPPWKAVPGYGEFHDANVLSADEIKLFETWARTGTPRGDRRLEPRPPTFPVGWQMGKPDLELTPNRPFTLMAEGHDVYRNFVFRTSFKERKYIRAIDVQPGNRRIVHHVIAFLDNRGQSHRLEQAANDGQEGYLSDGGGVGFLPDGSLGGWAPGIRVRNTHPGTAFALEPGATIVVQIHYHPNGREEVDQTRIGLYFDDRPVEKALQVAWIMNFRLDIPAGEKQYRISSSYPVPRDITMYAVMPHMHLLGREMKAWVELPDKQTAPLVHINDWDFNWQLLYALKKPMRIPKGSVIRVDGVYDNSADNPRQPSNPPKRVRWGEETTDEMFLLVGIYSRD
jgi:hypothetical protein